MEVQHMSITDMEKLKYKGTSENPDVKIFVSHSTDFYSEVIQNSVYIPVQCGADKISLDNVIGDNTGDNISSKSAMYGDLTVQYWAWKNVKSDYYGFCTSQKFLCIDDSQKDVKISSEEKTRGLILTGSIPEANNRFGLNDDEAIKKLVSEYDVITVEDVEVPKLAMASVNEYLLADMYHFDSYVITELLKVIQYKFPSMLPFANRYLLSTRVQKEAMCIVSKAVLDEFCEFEFETLSILEKRLKLEHAGAERKKLFSVLGSHLWGIFLLYLSSKTKYIIKKVPGIYCKSDRPYVPIEPAFSENNVPVVFSSSNAFAPYLGVALKSMMDNVSDTNNYDIIVLEKSIKDEEKEKICKICSVNDNVSVRFVNTTGIVANVNFYVPTKDLSEETYYTVLVPWILQKYKKALVLDCDIIINHDVAELYNTDITDKYLAAVKEIVYLGFLNNPCLNVNNSLVEYTEVKLGMDEPYDYFNAGVLLMNLEKFRENYTMECLLDMINKNRFSIVEQDLLNYVCAGKVHFLSYAWNFMSCLTSPDNIDEKLAPSDTTVPNLRLAPENEIELYKKASEKPHIYHYLTKMKPWKCPYLKYADIWWRVARTTVYYETFLYHLARDNAKAIKEDVQVIQSQMVVQDNRSGARKLADKLLPVGSRKRAFVKWLLPKGSLRWRFCKQIYYIIRPQYRPAKSINK